MKIIDIPFFTYPVTDMKRARAFYEGVLGLVLSRSFGTEEKGFYEYDLGHNTLALGNGAEKWQPSPNGGAITFEVDEFNAFIKHLKDNAVSFVLEPLETPGCRMCAISDPDGNSILIHQRKQTS